VTGPLTRRFAESTRGRILALLRAAPRTVEELRAELGLTDNAVRPHLVALERDGLVRQAGARRGEGAGKPAVLFELHPDAAPLLSRAYAPLLASLAEVLNEALTARDVRKVLRAAGRRLAETVAARPSGDLHSRARSAAAALVALGADVELETPRGSATIRGSSCPLAAAVARNPAVCAAMEALVAEVAGASVTERCDRTASPRCCFTLRGPVS
jgi:predicted ArsR family transcriptional regulator